MIKNREHRVSSKNIDKIINKYREKPGAVLSILEQVQEANRYQYIPQTTLQYIARQLGISLARLYGVVTFYSFFNLKPQGEHTITICRGTACHTRGSKQLLERAKELVGIKQTNEEQSETEPMTTADNKFTIRNVACFGQCALAPVIEVDNHIHSHLDKKQLEKIIKGIK